ncbi:hypothetical protein JRC49_11565 [Clostridiales bacterium FE2011]|nr:hypothetical protein JRC49_11565 [Clostridiales bacterium FE2011]
MYYYSLFYTAGESGYEKNAGNPDGERRDDRMHRRKIKGDFYESQTTEPGQMGIPVLSVLPDAD